MFIRRGKRTLLMAGSVLLAGLLVVPTGLTPAKASVAGLQQAFEQAAEEFGVPLSVLMSVGYNESRWEQHPGEPSASGGYGVMHLTDYDLASVHGSKGEEEEMNLSSADDPAMHTLQEAAELLQVEPDVLKHDMEQNIRGGAALLAEYARDTVGELPADSGDWYGAVAKYAGSDVAEVATDFADVVYDTINSGVERTTREGNHAVIAPQAVTPNPSTADPLHLRNADKTGANCPNGLNCRYLPAAYKQYSGSSTDYGNYDLANRPADGLDIRYIIIHDVEGSYQSAIKTFLGKSYVSSHYVIDSTNGNVTEMVHPENVPWHAGNWYFNSHSIGIEHSGFAVEGATWYSEQMYQASAKLVKYLAERYDIPLDRQHILGHDDLPGLAPSNHTRMHWDPGAFFDWGHYFDLLGASFNPSGGDKDSGIVTIDVNFEQNTPPLMYNNRQLELQPASFVYLRTEPRADAPLISDPALQPGGQPGTTQIYDWGNKAVVGRSYYQADQQGDWTAIYYGGKKAWFHNPKGKHAVPGDGLLVRPRSGLDFIPVYGSAFPELAAYQEAGIPARLNTPLQYRIPAGQVYVATEPVQSSYFYAKIFNAPQTYKVVKGNDEYYQISFNHRVAFVKKSDVEVVSR